MKEIKHYSYEDFRIGSERGPILEGNWIYRVERYEILEITENMYPKFDIWKSATVLCLSFDDAQDVIRKMTGDDSRYNLELTYCFEVSQIPIGIPDSPAAIWLFDKDGKLLDCTPTHHHGNVSNTTFFGRPADKLRFKGPEIVEVRYRDEITLSLLMHNPPSPAWCWDLYLRCINDKEPINYMLDASDDCCYVIDGPGYEFHDHVSPIMIMKPRFNIPPELRKEMMTWPEKLMMQE